MISSIKQIIDHMLKIKIKIFRIFRHMIPIILCKISTKIIHPVEVLTKVQQRRYQIQKAKQSTQMRPDKAIQIAIHQITRRTSF